MGALILLVITLLMLGALAGWLVPKLFKSDPPYGLAVDIAVCSGVAVVAAIIEWVWILPALNFTGWLKLAAAIGDPLGFGLISLWVLRKIKA
jgi:hypothetical protein